MERNEKTEELAGYTKKSFALPYNNGEIWFEHLDGIYDKEDLVLKKLSSDRSQFTRPSSTAYICFVLDETTVTASIRLAVIDSILKSSKRFMKVAFTGLDKPNKRMFLKELSKRGFALGFFAGLEDAKMWFLPV